MRKAVIAITLAFAVTLAVVVGSRMSAEAMAVVIGMVCGVGAGIPMSLLILLILNRRDRLPGEGGCQPVGRRDSAYPPVVVIQGGSALPNQLLPPYYPTQAANYQPTPRQFHVVGEEVD